MASGEELSKLDGQKPIPGTFVEHVARVGDSTLILLLRDGHVIEWSRSTGLGYVATLPTPAEIIAKKRQQHP